MKGKIMFLCAAMSALCAISQAREKWTPKQAQNWRNALPEKMAGANYINRDSINQIEMWSAESFNPAQIDQELGWAQELGFNTVRVFLHDLVWEKDPEGFLQRMEKFLQIADSHKIKPLFVFFDSCWNPIASLGRQPAPREGVHNSGWVQSPARAQLFDKSHWGALKMYVVSVISRFGNDPRVLGWDIFNEPAQLQGKKFGDESDKIEFVRELLQKSFEWARSANPSQPVTAGVYEGRPFKEGKEDSKHLNGIMLSESDVISFHVYSDINATKECVENLKRFKRPMICTEYMARPVKSTFDPILGYLVDNGVIAINWGFVNGKSQTIYPWDSWEKKYTQKTLPVWFHDILNPDGTPYDKAEAAYIKKVLKN